MEKQTPNHISDITDITRCSVYRLNQDCEIQGLNSHQVRTFHTGDKIKVKEVYRGSKALVVNFDCNPFPHIVPFAQFMEITGGQVIAQY